MTLRLVQRVSLEPDWPEWGERIRLAEVEATFPAGSDDRAGCYFLLADGRTRVWPWRESGYYVDERGEVVTATGPLPMSRPRH